MHRKELSKKLIVLDIDGTLIDIRKCRKKYDMPLQKQDRREM